jgi:hypothetical protein
MSNTEEELIKKIDELLEKIDLYFYFTLVILTIGFACLIL